MTETKITEKCVNGFTVVQGLTRCPFCGSTELQLKSRVAPHSIYYYLSCPKLSCPMMQTRSNKNKQRVYDAWNKRGVDCNLNHVPEPKWDLWTWFQNFLTGE